MISKVKGVGMQLRDWFLIPLSIAFFIVTGGVYTEAASMHHVWFAVNLFNGLAGAIFIIYPWDSLRIGYEAMVKNWWRMMFTAFFCMIGAMMISSYLGLGDAIF